MTVQRRARDPKQLHKQPFTVLEGVEGPVNLGDHGLEEIGVLTSVGVYLCRVMLKIDQDEFMKGSGSEVASSGRSWPRGQWVLLWFRSPVARGRIVPASAAAASSRHSACHLQ